MGEIMEFTKPKSEVAKKALARTSFKDRGYIQDLLFLEKKALGKLPGWAGNVNGHILATQYPKEYKAILKELNPKAYQAAIKEQKKQEKEFNAIEQELKEKQAKEKIQWEKIGG